MGNILLILLLNISLTFALIRTFGGIGESAVPSISNRHPHLNLVVHTPWPRKLQTVQQFSRSPPRRFFRLSISFHKPPIRLPTSLWTKRTKENSSYTPRTVALGYNIMKRLWTLLEEERKGTWGFCGQEWGMLSERSIGEIKMERRAKEMLWLGQAIPRLFWSWLEWFYELAEVEDGCLWFDDWKGGYDGCHDM